MMRKILLFSALVALSISCKEDSKPTNSNTGPSTPEKKYNTLLMMGSELTNANSAKFEAERLRALDNYPSRVNTLHMLSIAGQSLSIAGTPYYEPYADTIMMNFQSPIAPYFVIGYNNTITEMDVMDEIKYDLRTSPLLAVSNSVTENDTAWVIDHKVKFFMDTITDDIHIDTYMLVSLKASVYEVNSIPVDLRMAAAPNLIKHPSQPDPLEAQWDLEIDNVDSTKVLVNNGDAYYHQNLFFDKFDSTSTWGFPLGDYWPFGGEFYNGDIIGTSDTRIRHFFRKPNLTKNPASDLIKSYDIKFMSIVWVRDPATGSYVHANSYINPTVYRVK